MNASGICPSCGDDGELGTPCPAKICSGRGYHRIPQDALPPDDRRPEPELGLLLDRRYLLTKLLGEGGFGRVFVALQLPLGMRVAVKVLKKDRDADAHATRMRLFRQEAEAMAQLSHPNIVQLKDFGFFEGAAYLVLEFVEGGRTLKDEIRARAREHRELALAEVEAILDGVLNGLEEAHSKRIIHRDIKPENIMLQAKSGHPLLPRLLDFGLAKFVDAETQSSAIMGTPIYMAPEQLTKTDPGPWTDLYAVGVLAYELMTGRRPFGGELGEVIAQKRNPHFDVLEAIRDLNVPTPIASFLSKALAFDPQARFRSAAELRASMHAALKAAEGAGRADLRSIDLTELVETSPRTATADPPRKRSARWLPLGILAAAGLTVAIVLATSTPHGADEPPAPPATNLATATASVPTPDTTPVKTAPEAPETHVVASTPEVAAPGFASFPATFVVVRQELGFAIGGTVASVAVKPGQAVAKGAVLATLDARGAQADLAQAQEEYEVNVAEGGRAREALMHAQAAYDANTISAEALEQAKTAWAFAIGFVEKASKKVANAKYAIAAASLRAGRAGRIAEVRADVGQVVQAKGTILVFDSSDGAAVECDVPAEDAARLALDTPATVTLDNAPTVSEALVAARVAALKPLAGGGARVTFALAPGRIQPDPPLPWTAHVSFAR